MAVPSPTKAPPTLLWTTFRRSLGLGRLFIVVGLLYVVVLAVAESLTAPASFASSFPIFLPIFTVLGSMGSLMVFSNDRTKGVFEYLLAYGLLPQQLFLNVLLVSLMLESLVLGLMLGLGLGIFVATGNTISWVLVAGLSIYSVPMSYASTAFAAMVGVFWTSLSTPRSGLNSPIGLVPFIGIGPSVLTLGLVAVLAIDGFTDIYLVIGAAVGVIAALVLLFLGLLNRLMPRERLLSPI